MIDRSEDAEHLHEVMMAALDGELDATDQSRFEAKLKEDPTLLSEWDELVRVKEVTAEMRIRMPSDKIWSEYWESVYRRLERGLGWVLISIGVIVLASFTIWTVLDNLIHLPGIPWYLRGAMLCVIVGVVILFVSVIREKLFLYRTDPFKDVHQ